MAYTTIDDPSAHFQTKIYTDGDATTNDTTSQTFDGNSDLQPDLMWFKSRNVVGNHGWMDTSRGKDGGTSFKTLFVTDAAERTSSSGYDLTSMNSDGFSYGRPNQLDWAHDTPAQNVVWAWKCNGGTTSSNSDGSITSTVQANTTAGFSIITYTGTGSNATIGHGLGSAPTMVIVKNRDSTEHWMVGHHKNSNGFQSSVFLNLTAAKDTDAVYFNDTAPTSTVISIGTNNKINHSSENHVMYAFAEKQGYSKFGTFEGNNNADGPFVYTGFKPAWIMIKNIDAAKVWFIWDNARDTYNVANHTVEANANSAEANTGTGATNYIDMLSNGFKVRETGSHLNPDSETVIYMAFAESPFVSSEGVPTTAR